MVGVVVVVVVVVVRVDVPVVSLALVTGSSAQYNTSIDFTAGSDQSYWPQSYWAMAVARPSLKLTETRAKTRLAHILSLYCSALLN